MSLLLNNLLLLREIGWIVRSVHCLWLLLLVGSCGDGLRRRRWRWGSYRNRWKRYDLLRHWNHLCPDNLCVVPYLSDKLDRRLIHPCRSKYCWVAYFI